MATRESVRPGARDDAGVPGEDAERPTEIPARGWLQIVKRGWAEAKVDQVPLLGAGVAFFAFLALFPAVIALVTLYGLFADPAVIADQVNSLAALPAEVRQLRGRPDQTTRTVRLSAGARCWPSPSPCSARPAGSTT